MQPRYNHEGIARDKLPLALLSRTVVGNYRRMNSCLLCRRSEVNEAALCAVCFSQLEGEEYRLANRWLTGEGPP